MAIVWKPNPPESVPRHCCQMIAFDDKGRMLVMHRGPNVRSARNVWSFPSGLHDIGDSLVQTVNQELEQEYGLTPKRVDNIGAYENIGGDPEAKEQYHWVITMFIVLVEDVSKAINKEPEKHDDMQFVSIGDFASREFFTKYPMHVSMQWWATHSKRMSIVSQMAHLLGHEICDCTGPTHEDNCPRKG